MLISPFLEFLNSTSNLMYQLPDKGLKVEIY